MKLTFSFLTLSSFQALEISKHIKHAGNDIISSVFGDDLSDAAAALTNHGCWCAKFESETPGGNAVDSIDKICKDWFKARRCLQAQEVTQNLNCEMGLAYNFENNQCMDTDLCQSQACNVDIYYANLLKSEIISLETTFEANTANCAVPESSGGKFCDIDLTAIPGAVGVMDTVATCPLEGVAGDGWKLVRRTHTKRWHQARDSLVGTAEYGTFVNDPLHASSFSRKFDDMEYTEFLFASGDCQRWLHSTKEAVLGGNGLDEWYGNQYRPIIASNVQASPYKATWYRRNGVSEDPWISVSNHFEYKIVYGEGHWTPHGWLNYAFDGITGGMNVFIR